MYELQTLPAPDKLAPLGQAVELRELPFGEMREAMGAAERPEERGFYLLAASLHVDGQPLGYEELQALPGRFSGGLTQALALVVRMHGLGGEDEPDEGPAGPKP